MRYDYDKKNKIVTMDGEGTLVLSKCNPAMYLSYDFCNNENFHVRFINHYVVSSETNNFRDKIKLSLTTLKYIWKK